MTFKLPERVNQLAKRYLKRLETLLLWTIVLSLSTGHFWMVLRALLTFYAVVIAVVAIWLITVELYTKYASSIFSERYVIPVPFANRQASR